MIEEQPQRLRELAVFENLLADPVYCAFCSMMAARGTLQERREIARFAGALYKAGSEDWTSYLKEAVLTCPTCLAGSNSRQKELPARMLNAAMAELSMLSQAAAIMPCQFESDIPWSWSAQMIDLQAEYLNRLMDIEYYGTGLFAKSSMFRLDPEGSGTLIPVAHPDPVRFDMLYGCDSQHEAILQNTRALLAGLPAGNLLLYGDAGTGKSASIKAAANRYSRKGLRLIEAGKDQLRHLPALLDRLALEPLKFIVYIDDLSFCEQDDSFAALKAVLEGSVSARPDNVVIYATSNRRHLVKESVSARQGDDVHRRDTLQETLSLSQRFGQCLFFERPNKEDYLQIARKIAGEFGMVHLDEAFDVQAESFAMSQGGRSARSARQFVSMYYSRKGINDALS